MWTITKLIKISKLTGNQYAEIRNGITSHIITGKIIPDYLINKTNRMKKLNIPRPDGFYELTEATCGGKCAIDIPKPKCIEEGCYSKNKCALYYFRSINDTTTNPISIFYF